MKHQAWDDGAILAGMAGKLGPGIYHVVNQKSMKTLCGKRVTMDHIANGQADCPDCLAAIEKRERGQAMLLEYERICNERGFKAANAIDWSNWKPGQVL
jgi:hypothetical protein